MYLLGLDVGSSFVKASLLDADSGKVIASSSSPDTELEIIAKQAGWAEQNPSVWWENVKAAIAGLRNQAADNFQDISAIGISYQMHGLVLVDKNFEVLRPAIIWCDSRAVQIGQQAAKKIGEKKCFEHCLNLPGNFTASKLKWVKDNEPDIYKKIHKIMLPGDFIAMKLCGEIKTTYSGLSEGILWDFKKEQIADIVLDCYGIDKDLIPQALPAFLMQGKLTRQSAEEIGLRADVPITYRAGDQPNNALSLKVLNAGEAATTAGTSGVIYGVAEEAGYDSKSRVNIFAHVNYSIDEPVYGVLMCINGTGICNRWLRDTAAAGLSYKQMDEAAQTVSIGSDGVIVLPYGNGAERTLENRDIGASVHGLNFNRHSREHLLRAGQEGIVFAMKYGLDIMKRMNVETKTIYAGCANMFLSDVFCETFASVTGATVELYNTDGAQGAARGAGIGAEIYKDYDEAFVGFECVKRIEPDLKMQSAYENAYENWRNKLENILRRS
jgi:xylulokinase